MRPALYEIKCYHQFGPLLSNLSRYLIVYTGDYSYLTLSGRQKKNIVQFSPKFHQFFIDVHGIQIRWNFCEIFFRFKDRVGHFI